MSQRNPVLACAVYLDRSTDMRLARGKKYKGCISDLGRASNRWQNENQALFAVLPDEPRRFIRDQPSAFP
jgi:hypothetical protein